MKKQGNTTIEQCEDLDVNCRTGNNAKENLMARLQSKVGENSSVSYGQIHVSMIDLNDFFSEESANKGCKKQPYSASGIITIEQMVIRLNEPDSDRYTGETKPGLGLHMQEQNRIIRNIYGLNPETPKKDIADLIRDTIIVRFISALDDSEVTIQLPTTITSSHLRALEFLVEKIKEASEKNNYQISLSIGGQRPNKSWYEASYEHASECNLREFIDEYDVSINDGFKQRKKDVHILNDKAEGIINTVISVEPAIISDKLQER